MAYERALEAFFEAHPAMSGICQYHADALPGEVVTTGLCVHPGVYVDENNARANARYVPARG